MSKSIIANLRQKGEFDLANELTAEINPTKAAKFIDNGEKNAKRFKYFVDRIEEGFKKAKRDLDGLRKAGAGDTEAVALLEGYVLNPVKELQETIESFFKVLNR